MPCWETSSVNVSMPSAAVMEGLKKRYGNGVGVICSRGGGVYVGMGLLGALVFSGSFFVERFGFSQPYI